MRGFLVLNGVQIAPDFLLKLKGKEDLVVAADGGGEWLKENNLIPDFLVGDFDSLSPATLAYYQTLGVKIKRYPKEKNHTDGYLGMQWLMKKNPQEIFVLGPNGDKIDHLLIFLSLLTRFKLPIFYVTKENVLTLLKGNYLIYSLPFTKFSLIPFRPTRVTLKKVGYPLDNRLLNLGRDLTISNYFLEEEIEFFSTRPIWFIGHGLNFNFHKKCL